MEKIMTQEFAKSGPFLFKSSFPFSRGVPKRKKRKHSIHHNADPNSSQKLMETIVSVNQLSLHKVVLFKYFAKKKVKEIMSLPNTYLNLAQEIVTTRACGGWCVCGGWWLVCVWWCVLCVWLVCVWWLVCLCGGWCACVVVGVLLLSSRKTV